MATRGPESRGGFSMESLRLPLAALGIFGILAGLGALLVEGQFGLIERVLIAAGVLLLGIYVALDPEDVWAKLTGRGAMYSGNTLVLAVAALVILGFFNVLGSRYQNKVDLTSNQQFTLGEQSAKLAQSLPAPIKVTAFLTSSDSRKQDFQTLLSDYAARSGGKLSFEFIDPETRPADAIAAGITETGTVVYQMGDKKQNSTGTTERDVSTALVKLQRPEKKIYFTTGHGERSLDSFDQGDFSQIKQALERDNFTTASLNLITTRTIPDDAAEVIIAGPTNPFLPEEMDVLRAYLEGNGKLFIMVGPGSQADFNDLLSKYQVAVNINQLVVDPAQPFLNDVRVPVVDKYGSHAITKDLRLATFYPAVGSITIPSGTSPDATVVALAQSSDQSWGNTNLQQIQRAPNDPAGPLPLMVAIEANQAGAAPAGQSGAAAAAATHGARIVVVATPNLVANRFLSVSSGNTDLFLDSANWLADQDNLIDVRAPETVSRSMLLTGPQINLVKFSSFLFLPLAVLAVGAAVWWTRR
jgi:ABC-type uncharacterized transport system involved in gliding motility auxiliary subunit